MLWLDRPVLQAWLPGTVLLTGLLLLSRTIGLTRLRWRRAVLSRHGIGLLRTRLHRLAAVRIGLAGIGAAERALFLHDLAAEILRGVNLAHKTLVARDLLRRKRQRYCREARAAGARADGKTARALRQRAEPYAAAIVDLDPADPAVSVGIKFDRDVAGCGGGAFRDLDQAGGAADAERCGRRRNPHVACLGHRRGDEGNRALGDVEQRAVLFAALLVDVAVDRDLGAGRQVERSGIVEGDAELRFRRRLDQIVGEDIVAQQQRRGGAVAGDGGAAG